MALVQVMKSAGTKAFGGLSPKYFDHDTITSSLLSFREVHIVFYQYWDLSIKATECAFRRLLNSCLEVKIRGPSTPMPKQ